MIKPPLTHRQAEVLAHVFMGKSNREIADTLFVTVKAIKFHMTAINKILGTRSRSEAMSKFFLYDIDGYNLYLIQKYFEPLLKSHLDKMKKERETLLPRGLAND